MRLLLSYLDGRTKVSRLSSMLPRVANLIIREAPLLSSTSSLRTSRAP